MTKMLPVPNIDSKKFKYTQVWDSKGEHTKLCTFSPSGYQNLGGIWNITADWADGKKLEVVQGRPPGADATPFWTQLSRFRRTLASRSRELCG